ncbi:MAG TPA: dihydrofolate reductase family protein [Ktedonobacterales bacterium]|nr:dihydrofolate reductase family protein [Ktedonobacterales bacterium]
MAVHVLLLAALTVDGRIARHTHELSDWTSREDKRLFVRTSKEAGVVVMGHATYATLPAPLPGRLLVVLTRQPDQPALAGVEFSAEPPARVLERLGTRGYSTVVLGGGARTYHAFLAAGLVDELWLTIEPLAFGAGIALFGDEPLAAHFTLLDCQRLGEQAVHLRYRVDREREPRLATPDSERTAADEEPPL